MKKKLFVRAIQLLPVLLCMSTLIYAQQLKLGDNPSALQKSALLELESKSQGLLLPRITDTTTGAITAAPDGMIIYLTLNKSLCIRSNGHWRPLLPEGYALTSLNGQTIAIQALATTNTAGTYGFTSAAGTHTLNIPDASATNSGFVNTGAQTLAGAKTFNNTLAANQDVYLRGLTVDNTKDSVLLIDGGKLLKKQLSGLPPTGNAGGDLTGTYPNPTIATGAVTGTKIAQAGATSGQVLKWNGTTWAPGTDDNSGSISSIGLSVPSPFTVSPSTLTANGTFTVGMNSQTANTVFASPNGSAGTASFRSLVPGDMTLSSTQRLVGRYSNGGGTGEEIAMDVTMKLNGQYLYVDTTLPKFNASKLQGVPVSFTAPANGQVLKYDGSSNSWVPGADNNTGLTSIGLSLPSMFTVATPNPLTANGTLTATLASQTAATFLGAPAAANGTPTFRTLAATDIPSLDAGKITTGTLPIARGGTGLTAVGTNGQVLTSNGTSLYFATPSAGTTFTNQAANTVFAGPTSGAAAAPAFRNLGISDVLGVNTQKLLGRYTTGTGATQEVSLDNTIKLNTGGTLYADSALAVWNASKVQGVQVLAKTPTSGQVLKYNGTSWEPNTDNDGGATYEKATTNDARYATADGSTTVMKIWQSPVDGTVTNGPAYTNAHAWSIMAFNGSNYTTQLYFDKNTMAIKEWGGLTAPLTSNAANGWYKSIMTNGNNKIGVGAIVYGKRTSDASAEAASDSSNFYYNETSKRLGIGTSSPLSTLDVQGSLSLPIYNPTATGVSYTMTDTDYTYIKSTTGNHTVTLPNPTTCKGRIYVIKKYTNGGNTGSLTIQTANNNGQIEGSTANTVIAQNGGKISYTLQSDGTGWWIISGL